MSDEVEFALIAECGILEAQAVLLCESIRAFAGRYAGAKISVISPRPTSRPSDSTLKRFARLRVDYLALDLHSPVPEYGTSYRVLGLGWLSRQPGPPVLVQLDSDTIFVAEPDLALGDDIAAARPVDEVGMCSVGPGDPRETLWETMCRANGISAADLPSVLTTVDRVRVRASYNGGLIVARRGLFAQVEESFLKIVGAGLQSFSEPTGMRIGAGWVTATGFAMWGTSQAAITISVANSNGSVRILDEAYNIPLHLLERLRDTPSRLIHLHYHWLFNDQDSVERLLGSALPLTHVQRDWLTDRLPLTVRAAGEARLFNHPRLVEREQQEVSEGPACTVVMTAHNSERFIHEAVGSVLHQDFHDFDFVIVDDCSDDPETCHALEKLDERIRVLRNSLNVGTAAAANRGIKAARSDIIVRLDSDDVAEPGRVGRLVEALRADPELGLVGSAVLLIDEAGQSLGVQSMPETDFEIRWTLLFHNPFYHSAVAFRRKCFERAGRYRPDERISQDHYLWFDMLPFCRARNLAAPLVRYRHRSDSLTATYGGFDPRERTRPIRESLWREIGLAYGPQSLQCALDVSALLRGQDVIGIERRAAAAGVILSALSRVLALRQDFVLDGEQVAVDLFEKALAQRFS